MTAVITAVVVSGRRGVDQEAWDDFATRYGAGFRGSYQHIFGWSLKNTGRARVRFVQLHTGGPLGPKVGQCAVALTRRGGHFLDRLVLSTDATHEWPDAMKAVLAQLVPGTYTYGWELNLEPSREQDLAAIPGVTTHSVRPVVVQVVEFENWPSWDAYLKSVSTNVRRNAKKATTEFPDLAVATARGWRAVSHLVTVVRFRSEMYRRKGVGFRSVFAAVNAAANFVAGGDRVFSALAVGEGRPLAAFTGSTFGRITYYLEGASSAANLGASWYLMVEMLRTAYEANPRGRFVFGYVDHSLHDEDRSGGLLRSRRSCRVTDLETSIVEFDWSPSNHAPVSR